jgi:hypothetical protein
MAQTAPAKDAAAHALDEDDAFEVRWRFRLFGCLCSLALLCRSLRQVSRLVRAGATALARVCCPFSRRGGKKEFTRAQVTDDQRAWAEDWDDDEVDDAFSKQLRAELVRGPRLCVFCLFVKQTKSGHVASPAK